MLFDLAFQALTFVVNEGPVGPLEQRFFTKAVMPLIEQSGRGSQKLRNIIHAIQRGEPVTLSKRDADYITQEVRALRKLVADALRESQEANAEEEDDLEHGRVAIPVSPERANVLAFLDLISWAEGTAKYTDPYRVRVFDPPPRGSIASLERKPNVRRYRRIKGVNTPSTAEGRYQIVEKTWAAYAPKAGVRDFSPRSQDLVAIEIIRGRGALADVQAGRIATAISKLRQEWASFPGGTGKYSSVQHKYKLNVLLNKFREFHERRKGESVKGYTPARDEREHAPGNATRGPADSDTRSLPAHITAQGGSRQRLATWGWIVATWRMAGIRVRVTSYIRKGSKRSAHYVGGAMDFVFEDTASAQKAWALLHGNLRRYKIAYDQLIIEYGTNTPRGPLIHVGLVNGRGLTRGMSFALRYRGRHIARVPVDWSAIRNKNAASCEN